MKKILAVIMAVVLTLAINACGDNASTSGQADGENTAPAQETAGEREEETADKEGTGEEAPAQAPDAPQTEGKTLVVYFSATGTTREIAEKLAALTGADLYELKAAQEYTSDDLNWNDADSRTTHEQEDPSARPEIGSDPVSLEGYSTVYVGYPIWWGEEPRIMDTFVEGYDFDGITVIPFCTSGSSGIGESGKHLADNAGSGNWLDGQRFGAGASESELQSWIQGLE